MRKFLAVAFFVAVSLLTVACGNSEPSNSSKPAEPAPQSSGSSSVTANASDILPDVPVKHFARTSVLYVVKNEIMLPYGDGTFRGDKPVTNYEFAMGLAKILDDTYTGTIEVRSMPFSDVPPQHWAYENVLKLAYAGVEEGYADGTFRGDRQATRYETAHSAAKLLVKVAPSNAKSIKSSMPYPDVPKDHWAYKSVAYLSSAGITIGYGDGTYRGDRPRTRYEAAQMLAKLHSFLKKSNG